MLSWSSGLGCHPLTVEDAGSNPAGSEKIFYDMILCMYNRQQRNSNQPRPVYVNEKIKAFNVMVVGADGENVWVVPRAKALQMAYDQWLDLVQVAYNPKDKISTAKIVDFWKYMYEKWKKEREKKKQQAKWLKQIKMWYSIGDNDLAMKVDKAVKSLEKWYTVKFFIKIRWRERVYKDKVIQRLKTIKEELQYIARSQYPHPKEERNGYSIILLPNKSN